MGIEHREPRNEGSMQILLKYLSLLLLPKHQLPSAYSWFSLIKLNILSTLSNVGSLLEQPYLS